MEMSRRYNYQPIGASHDQPLTLSYQENLQCTVRGYESSIPRVFLYHTIGLLFLGIPYMVASWYPILQTLKLRKCSLEYATIIMVHDNHGENVLIEICEGIVNLPNRNQNAPIRYFNFRHTKYVWIDRDQSFGPIESLIPPLTVDDHIENLNGLSEDEYLELLKLYGHNKIEVEVKSYWTLLIEEIFNPFYIFQAFSVTLWCFDDYLIYAGCVLVLTIFSVVTALLQTRKQSEAIHDLVESSQCHQVTVLRKNVFLESLHHEIDPIELVPGDLIVVPKANFILPCDAVLLTGQCIVNESMLTGESVPVTKTALHSSNELYSPSIHKRHTLFSGTHMIQTRYYGGQDVLARVVRTGFETTKGALVKSILFPTPVGLQFYKDSLKFVFCLFVIAAIGTGYCLHLYYHRRAPVREIVIRCLDIITIVVPPALPAALTVGIVYSQGRLKKLGIFCISPPRINVCGKIKLACFDKTGTLTHDGLDVHSVVPCSQAKFTDPVVDCDYLDVGNRLVQGMAACHSLTEIEGKITGDPLDLCMFGFTNWYLEEPGGAENERFDMLAPTVVKPRNQNGAFATDKLPYEIGIIRQFPFSSTLQCMSVICRELNSTTMTAFVKGAPEKIFPMCVPSTVPNDFSPRLMQYTAKGYRVIAIAYKDMHRKFKWTEAQRVKRNIIECDLTFLGLLIMQNPLKDETTPVIRTLQEAKIQIMMITGDNILTAVSVARDCEMIKPTDDVYVLEMDEIDNPDVLPPLRLQNIGTTADTDIVAINFDSSYCHFAMDGRTWSKLRTYYPDLLPNLIVRTKVFARFQPDQKTQLVTYLQCLDYTVSMVGDGANDCGALKAAHVGVSLSQAEASVAAPFTSSIQDISCLIHLMMEGRCALVTSFAVFKYMAMYSLIQFFTVLILYKHRSMLGDTQFLFIDLIITTTLAVAIGRQGPYGKLVPKSPPASLVAVTNLIPMILQVVLCFAIQIGSFFYLYKQSWFKPVPNDGDEEVIECWENTVLFTVSCFQYIILATVYSKGRPYREMLITNFWFLVSALALTCFDVWLLISPSKKVAEFFEIIYLPHNAHEQLQFRYLLLAFPLVHLAASLFIEVFIAERGWVKKIVHCIKRKELPKNRYKVLLQDVDFQYWLQRDAIAASRNFAQR